MEKKSIFLWACVFPASDSYHGESYIMITNIKEDMCITFRAKNDSRTWHEF